MSERSEPVYDQWVRREGVPIIRGLAVDDLSTVPVGDWPRRGVRGTFIKLQGSENINDAYVVEIPPGSQENPEQHVYEELIFILSGRGGCSVWNNQGGQSSFEFEAGAVFSIPLNAHHQFYNGSGQRPLRYLGVTLAPLMMNLLHNLDVVFHCSVDFLDRFNGESRFFSDSGTALDLGKFHIWETNFVRSVYDFVLKEQAHRGAGGKNIMLELGHSAMGAHISEFPVGTYKKAHRHPPGSHVVILSGEGYSLMWQEEGEVVEIPWQRGTMLVPPNMWFHQHFNTGSTPARYLALRANSQLFPALRDQERASKRDQIEYADQAPDIHQRFVAECALHGAVPQMSQFFSDSPHR